VANLCNDLDVQECEGTNNSDQDRVDKENKWRAGYDVVCSVHDDMGLGQENNMTLIWREVCTRLAKILTRTTVLSWARWRDCVRELARDSGDLCECNDRQNEMYPKLFEKFASDLYGVNVGAEAGVFAVFKQCDLFAIARAGLALLQTARPPIQDWYHFEDMCHELLRSSASQAFRRVDLRELRERMVRFNVVAM